MKKELYGGILVSSSLLFNSDSQRVRESPASAEGLIFVSIKSSFDSVDSVYSTLQF